MESIFQAILHMQTPFNMVVVVVMITCAAAVVKFIAMELRKFGCHRQDIDFKREMIERGLSAEEIERIVAASGSNNDAAPTTVNVGNYVGTAAEKRA